MPGLTTWLTAGLDLVNQVLAATIVLTLFSLLVYLLTYNLHSRVARAFCALMAFVLLVYAGDVLLYKVNNTETAIRWLTFQWIGIAFVPAAYLHFSDALLRTLNLRARWRRVAVLLSYVAGAAFLGMVLFTELLVYDGVHAPLGSHLRAGEFFWVFAVYYALVVLWGAANMYRARRRALTRATRRRMTYLGLSFVAPAVGVFPYLMLPSIPSPLSANWLQLLLMVGNVAVLLMIILMAYSVAYFGAFAPDRIVKNRLVHYLLRGPLVGAAVILLILTLPKVEQISGLRRDTVLIFAVVALIVLSQLAIDRARPFIDRAIYRQDQKEIAWIQALDQRLLTTGDLRAFLENSLAALCDLLQVRTGFVAVLAGGHHRVEAHCGDVDLIHDFIEKCDLSKLVAALLDNESKPGEACLFYGADEFWLLPLEGSDGDSLLGVLGVEARHDVPALAPDEKEIVELLMQRVREALEDRYLQQNVFDTLNRILPKIERLHRWQDATRYPGVTPMEIIGDSTVDSPEFQQWVRDALSHYWGGQKLTESPLLGLHVVRDTMHRQDANAAQALRTVLGLAIERLRPTGERSMTASEWLLYNILELKFLRGLRVRDVARRLAISESDLYRKQRVAISEVAQALADLERNGSGMPAADVVSDNRLDKQV
ncbi:MAG: hypothetical protein JXA93_10900 [Anaerolineae bacterium]|nr:hypothetical protein [Anaerolineae bacterium]